MEETKIVVAGEWQFKNKKLEKLTKDIINNGRKTTVAMYNIAKALAEIDETKVYEDDGFTTIYDYSESVFGFKKSYVSKLINAHRRFLADPESPVRIAEFSTTQIAEMLPQKNTEIVYDMVNDGEISPDMTKDAIREIIKESIESNVIEGEYEEVNTEPDVKTEAEIEVYSYHVIKTDSYTITKKDFKEWLNSEKVNNYKKIKFIDNSPSYLVELADGTLEIYVL